MKKLFSVLLIVVLSFGLIACDSNKKETEDKVVIKIGVVGEYHEYWQPAIDKLAEDGITIELVKFSDYAIPNQALADKDIDMNAFQHYAYLGKEIEERGFDLEVIGETIIAPLGLYSNKISSVSEFKEGDKIAIPNDATNGGRALKLLEEAGLIEIDPAVGYLPTINDITANPLSLEIIEVNASMTATLLPDVTASIINGGNAITVDLNPARDAIYLETVNVEANPNANAIINVLVVRSEDIDSEVYKKVLAAFQSEETAKVMEEIYGGAFIPAWK